MRFHYIINHEFILQPLVLDDLKLFQIGRVFCTKDHYSNTHYHSNWYELTIINDGEGFSYRNSTPIPIKKGDMFFSSIFDHHQIVSNKDNPLKYDFFAFYPTNNELNKKLSLLSSYLPSNKSRIFNNERIPFLIDYALHEFSRQNDTFTKVSLNNILYEIIIYLIRSIEKKESNNQSPSSANILCFQIMEHIKTNIYSLKKISDICNDFNYSYNYISSIFKKTTGTTIIEFYSTTRLTLAKTLIKNTTMSLTEISKKLNFSTLYTFSNTFKKHFGVSPSFYRNNSLTKENNEVDL